MSWQDELQQLDTALAGGLISADDYRRRRDQLLAMAAGQGGYQQPQQQMPQQPAPQQPAPQQQGPGTPPGGNSPFPQAFRWDAAGSGNAEATQMVRPGGPGGDQANQTQIVSGVGGADSADRTQVVPGAGGMGGGPERTQMVRPNMGGQSPFPPQPGQWQAAPPQQQQQGGGDFTPPWAGADRLQDIGAASWIRQGPEVFDESGGGGAKKIILIVVIAVLLIGGGVTAFFLINNNSSNSAGGGGGGSTTTSQPTATTPKPPDDLAIAKLPGNGQSQPKVSDISDVAKTGTLTSGESQTYQTAGASVARLQVATLPQDVHVLVLTVRTDSATSAATAVTSLAALQSSYGMQTYAGTVPTGVKIDQIAQVGNNPATIRAHYSHKSTVVRVQVYGSDLTSISKTFDEILAAQLQSLPADS